MAFIPKRTKEKEPAGYKSLYIKEKLIKRAEKYTKEIEPEMKNIKQLKQVIDDYLKGKEQSIKIVMLREFSNSLGYILDKYKMSFLPKKEEI